MTVGRRRSLDDAKQREICALVSAGCGIEQAARYIGCAPNTIRREALRNAGFSKNMRQARLSAQLQPLQAMQQAAATHWRAAAWMLERTDPEHFARHAPTAFRPKQARALLSEVLAIVAAEVPDPLQYERLERRIRAVMKYALHDIRDNDRSREKLRQAMKYFDEIDRENNRASGLYAQFARQSPFGGEPSAAPSSAAAASQAMPGDFEPTQDANQLDPLERPATQADLAGILRNVCQTFRKSREAAKPTSDRAATENASSPRPMSDATAAHQTSPAQAPRSGESPRILERNGAKPPKAQIP